MKGALVLLLLTLSMRAAPALAHYEWGWIMSDPVTQACCDERDCKMVRARLSDDGERWQFMLQGKPMSTPYTGTELASHSDPSGFWACYYCSSGDCWLRTVGIEGVAKPCFFVPHAGG